MLVHGQLRTCWNCADLSVLPDFRRHGLAVRLRQAARAGVNQREVEFLYGHPNAAAAGAHQKAGNTVVGRMVRYARPLRTAGHLERRLRSRILSRAAGAVVDPLLRLASKGFRHRPSHRLQVVSGCRFDERFDRLCEEHAQAAAVVGVRDARYLNWRYADNPQYESHAILAEDAGRLCGYLVFTSSDDQLYIKDVFPPSDAGVLRDLIAAAIREGDRQGMHSVSLTVLESNPVVPVLEEFGLSQRPDDSQMFAYAPADSPLHQSVLNPHAWYLTVGDRDV
jgi:hypothetical protein